MNPIRVLTCLIIVGLSLSILILPTAAYDNVKVHPIINKYAFEFFKTREMLTDPYLKNTTLNGSVSSGYAWDFSDGMASLGLRDYIQVPRDKPLREWITNGGFSADEPEMTMGLVHFFDPTNKKEPWLTDKSWLQNKYTEASAIFFKDESFQIPELSAIHWTFDGSGWGTENMISSYYIQDYSWDDGLRYYKLALNSKDENNPNYGQAWRSVGETMHMISDMTVPAHVRNDGHITLGLPVVGSLVSDPDPYESSVRSEEVEKNAALTAATLDYDRDDLQIVMRNVALFTNQNFLTNDTAPYMAKGLGSSDLQIVNRYPDPSVKDLVVNEDGYLLMNVTGTYLKVAKKEEHLSGLGIEAPIGSRWYSFEVDPVVLADQSKMLIPTAIRASEEVLDRFLPRFEARLSVEKYLPDDPDDDQYGVHAMLNQKRSNPDAWKEYPEDLIVRNGAYLVEITPDGKQNEIPLSLEPTWVIPPLNPNFNDWKDLFKLKPGTRLYLMYDLGGYVIRSNEVTIPQPAKHIISPTPTVSSDTGCNQFSWGDGECKNYQMLHAGYGIYVDKGWIDRPEYAFEFTVPSSGTIEPSYNLLTGIGGSLGGLLYINGEADYLPNYPSRVQKDDSIKVIIYPGPMTRTDLESREDEYHNVHLYYHYTYPSGSAEGCLNFKPDTSPSSIPTSPTPRVTPIGTTIITTTPTPGVLIPPITYQPTHQVTPTPSPTFTLIPDVGTLAIESDPSGAQVLVDGVNRGMTPLKVEEVPAGSHTVELAIYNEDGSDIIWSGSERVTLTPYTTVPVIIKLMKNAIVSPTPTPGVLIPPITYQPTHQVTPTPSPTFTLIPDVGTLAIESDPSGAQVLVDGVNRGMTPLKVEEVPAGSHTLDLAIYNEDGSDIIWSGSERVILTSYTTVPVMITLTRTTIDTITPPPTLTLTTQATLPPSTTVSGITEIIDWDKAGDSFSFKSGVCSGCGSNAQGSDLFIADRGANSLIHVFESPGIVDMGAVELNGITAAPVSGYVNEAVPVNGHSYVIRSRGIYGKIRITKIDPSASGSVTKYNFAWEYQPDGSGTF